MNAGIASLANGTQVCARHGEPLSPTGICWECAQEADERRAEIAEDRRVAEFKYQRDLATGNLPPSAADLARLKAAFAAAITDGIEGAANLRKGLLCAWRNHLLTADAVPAALEMIATMRAAQADPNPCNDDAPAAPAPAPSTRPLHKGEIVTNDAGQIVRLYLSKTGNLYGKVRDEEGSWVYAPGVMKGARHLTADEAAAYGKATDHCVFCSRALTDDRSVAVGYGEICASNMGLPW